MRKLCWLLPAVLLLAGCTARELMEALSVMKPTVQYEGVRISALTFESVTLDFDMRIRNPNGIGLKLSQYGYALDVAGHSVVSGRQPEGLALPANGQSAVTLPVTLKYRDLYDLIGDVRGQDSVDYTLSCDFAFNLPVLGDVNIPLKTAGKVPLLHLPEVSVKSFRIKDMSLGGGADVEVTLKVSQRQKRPLNLNGVRLDLALDGQSVMALKKDWPVTSVQGGSRDVVLPIHLGLRQMGSALLSSLVQGKNLKYSMAGALVFQEPRKGLGALEVPFDATGRLR